MNPLTEEQARTAGLNIIKRAEDEEGFLAGRCTQLKAYKPIPSEEGWTIGWGHHGCAEGMTITSAMADAALLEDVLSTETELRSMLRGVPLTHGQWWALVSLAYNVGARRLPTVAPKLWKALFAGDKTAACIQFADINRAGDKVLAGLTARRRAEQELFMS